MILRYRSNYRLTVLLTYHNILYTFCCNPEKGIEQQRHTKKKRTNRPEPHRRVRYTWPIGMPLSIVSACFYKKGRERRGHSLLFSLAGPHLNNTTSCCECTESRSCSHRGDPERENSEVARESVSYC